MCQFKDLLSSFSHWKVLKLKGQPGSELHQTDACEEKRNSKVYVTRASKSKLFYKKLKMTLDNSRESYTDRFPEDVISGWSQDQINALFKGAEMNPDDQQLSGFQMDKFQTDTILQLSGQIRLLAVRLENFKQGSQMFAAISLTRRSIYIQCLRPLKNLCTIHPELRGN